MHSARSCLKLAPVLLLSVLGCSESVESTDIRTSGIYPEFVVTANGSGSSRVEVWLKVGGNNSNTFLELRGEDELFVSVDGAEPTAIDEHSGDKYMTTIPKDAEGTEFSFSFLRGGDGDAPVSTVVLPAPFTLDVTTAEAIREQDDVSFEWDPPGTTGELSYELDGDCIFSESGDVPDSAGSHVVRAADIRGTSADEMESCVVDVQVTRARNGSIDAAFTEGGEITARQVRQGEFTSLPVPMPTE